ncbi:MAG: phosphomannomutase/phosphoglucomutase [Patescibacteria group bacterium]
MLPINSEIFKAYDIRGIYGQDFDNEMAYLLGLAFVELRKNDPDYQVDQKLQIAVACDMRLSSPALKDNLIRGLTDAGADAINLNLVSTPTFYYAVARYKYNGGIMISASHNPKEWNGFKLVRAGGVPVSGETGIEFIKESVLANRFLPSPEKGKIFFNDSALDDELNYTWSLIDKSKIKKIKIVADAANGMGSTYLSRVLNDIPGEAIPMNFELDGNFPAHEADPLKEENLEELKKEVIKQKADFGISTDGDGDRAFFIDDKGEVINQAIIRGLLAKSFLTDKPGARIGYDVRPGKITPDLIEENGGIPIITRVGHSLIKEQMIKEDIYFAGESSGHFYFNSKIGCFEFPSLMILKLLIIFSESPLPISDQVKQYKKYYLSGEINRSVNNKESVFSAIENKYSNGEINKLDGLTITFPDFWFNVRGSNTEPKVRLNLEAITPEIMIKKRDEILELIK